MPRLCPILVYWIAILDIAVRIPSSIQLITKKSHDPKRQGEWAEACFTVSALAKGMIVSKPYGDNSRYDFLVDAAGKISRVQVKSVSILSRTSFHVSVGRGASSKAAYSAADVDFIAAYV